jgi:hypothetical protein
MTDCHRFEVLIETHKTDPRARRVQRAGRMAVGGKLLLIDCLLWSCPDCQAWLQAKRGHQAKVFPREVNHTEHQAGECARFKEKYASGGRDGGYRN